MTPKESDSQHNFDFSYSIPKGNTIKISIPLSFPIEGLTTDLAEVYLKEYRIPCFVEDSFRSEFLQFVRNEEEHMIQMKGDAKLNDISEDFFNDLDFLADGQLDQNNDSANERTIDKRREEEYLGLKWHSLLHSPALPLVRAEESKAAHELQSLVSQRNTEIKKIQDHHILAMEGYVNNGTQVDSNAVNDLAASQMEQRQACEVKWASSISHLMEEQKKNFHMWVEQTHLDSMEGKKFYAPPASDDCYGPIPGDPSGAPRFVESFTVCIGSQLKITHNVRLAVESFWDLCGGVSGSPEQLQTSLSLYTNSLSGAIMVVDNRLNVYTGNTNRLTKVTELHPEFHFPQLEKQLSIIRQKLLNPDDVRRRTPTNYLIDETVPDCTIREDRASGDLILPTGTCYITRHSNLKKFHTVFHLVATRKEIHDDVTSRDPLLLGLKVSLKLAAENSIDNLYVPILLCHELDGNMDHAWCVRRAENVFKCVKGFMIEYGSTGATASKTFHFTLPRDTPERTFSAICSLLPSVFRVPCPMVFEARKKTLTVEELMKLNIDTVS